MDESGVARSSGLDSITFAKAKWSRQATWTAHNVNSIIRRTIYRGDCMQERVYPPVLEAVVDVVLSLDGVRDAVLARVRKLHEKGGSVATELKKLDKEKLPSAAKLLEQLEAIKGQLLGDEAPAAVIPRQLLDG